jgi:hypothetical protein
MAKIPLSSTTATACCPPLCCRTKSARAHRRRCAPFACALRPPAQKISPIAPLPLEWRNLEAFPLAMMKLGIWGKVKIRAGRSVKLDRVCSRSRRRWWRADLRASHSKGELEGG